MPPVFQAEQNQKWSIEDGDTERTEDSIYGSKSEIEYYSDEDNAQQTKSAYDNTKIEVMNALMVRKKRTKPLKKTGSIRSFSRKQPLSLTKGGSLRSLCNTDDEKEEDVRSCRTSIHGSVTSIEYNPEEDCIAEYVYKKAMSNLGEKEAGNSSVRGKVIEVPSKNRSLGKKKAPEKGETEEKSRPSYRREGSARSFSSGGSFSSFNGSCSSIEYIDGEDDIAQFVYEKAKKEAEKELLRTPLGARPTMEKQLSGYNFSAMLLTEES